MTQAIGDNQKRLGKVIKRMRKIQRSIKASGQPASMLELMELKDLGVEYAHIIERLANDGPDGTGLA